jgi:WD40 repeat protein
MLALRQALILSLLLTLLSAATAAEPVDDPLPKGAVARWGTLRLRQGGAVTALAFSPDGETVASGGFDHDITLWQSSTGKRGARLKGHEGAVKALVFSADGKRLLSGSEDRTVRLWDVPSGKELRKLEGHSLAVLSVAFSPDGKVIASAGADYSVRLWDADTGKERHELTGHDSGVNGVAFSPDGKTLASAGDDGTVRLWSTADGKQIRKIAAHEDEVLVVSFNADGKSLASAGKDEFIRFWNPESGKETGKLRSQSEAIACLAYSTDGKSLSSAGRDQWFRRWDLSSGKELTAVRARIDDLCALCLSQDGTKSAGGGSLGVLGLWNLTTGKELVPFQKAGGAIPGLGVKPDGKSLLFVQGGSVISIDPATAKEKDRFETDLNHVASITLAPDGKTLATVFGGINLELWLWDIETGKKRLTVSDFQGNTGESPPGGPPLFRGTLERNSAIAFSPDGREVVARGAMQTIRSWNAVSGKTTHSIKLGEESPNVRAVALAPDGRTVATAFEDHSLALFDLISGNEVRRWKGHEETISALTFSPDGGILVSTSTAPSVRLWEVSTGQEIGELKGQTERANAVTFAADGRTLLTGGKDAIIRAWDLGARETYACFSGHLRPVLGIVALPERRFASCGADGMVIVWEIDRRPEPKPEREPTATELAALWTDLSGPDAGKAHRAIWALVARRPQGVALVGEKLQPMGAVDGKRVEKLLADLDSEEFDIREKATKELEEMGNLVEGRLRKEQTQTTSAEVRRRLDAILKKWDTGPASPDKRIIPGRALMVLEHSGTPEAKELLKKLAGGAATAWQTQEAKAALERIARRSKH